MSFDITEYNYYLLGYVLKQFNYVLDCRSKAHYVQRILQSLIIKVKFYIKWRITGYTLIYVLQRQGAKRV